MTQAHGSASFASTNPAGLVDFRPRSPGPVGSATFGTQEVQHPQNPGKVPHGTPFCRSDFAASLCLVRLTSAGRVWEGLKDWKDRHTR